jgi:excisionase family DNA binding protein
MSETTKTSSRQNNEPELLRVSEAANLLGLSRTKVYEMTSRGEIPVIRIGTAVRVPRRKLLQWVDNQISGDAAVMIAEGVRRGEE